MTSREKIEAYYLEWFNYWLTLQGFADAHGLTIQKATRISNAGRKLNWRRPTLTDHWTRLRQDYPDTRRQPYSPSAHRQHHS